jgi:IS605 OrfB family transposase
MYNYNSNKKYYRFIDYANKNYAITIAKSIINFAIENNAYIIVFEHLDKKGKKSFLKERLHYWNCKMVQSITASLAHKVGIRFTTVCAWGTSKYAFDGSGEIIRHAKNRSICTFTTGKIYNADLSASYNIASRYFIKEIQKTISAKKWLDKVAKVPSLSKRSTCTLDTLIKLNKVLSNPSGLAVPV